ncbi:MAG TPA: hypothetical protein VFS58_16300 [Steroidobacteraceae bacterium]|nr:hypothetical protein [Steroidobacteraceae bacterium]
MGIFKWRGRVSRKDFRRRYMDAVQAAAPGCRCEESAEDDLGVGLEGLGEYSNVKVSLHRAYAEFEKDPDECDEILARWVRSIEYMWSPPKPIDPKDIVPMIKDRSWLAAQMMPGQEIPPRDSAESFWIDDYNEELVVVYAVQHNGFSYPPRSDLLAVGVNPGNIRELALENLRARTPDRKVASVSGSWMITAGGNFEASLLIDETTWSDPRLSQTDTLLVAVPERDGLFACTDPSVPAVWNLASMASHGVRTQPYPITAHLLVRKDQRFELLDPVDQDDEHPIPALDVIDISCQAKDGTMRYVIVIATPLAKDPRSVFRLFRKLDGYLGHIAGTEQAGTANEIAINIHQASDSAVFALLAILPEYVASRGARLVVERSN